MSSYSRQWTPDVFVSFQDDGNVVTHFTSSLFEQLKKVGIGYRYSHEADAVRFEVIHQARFALVVFSVNYLDSSRCLDELVEILFRRGDSKYPSLVVIPIFHGMAPAKVPELGEKGEFKQALRELPRNERDEKKNEWRRYLAKVEGISGYELKEDANEDDESVLTKIIVERLVYEIRSLYSRKVFGPFGGNDGESWHFYYINGIEVLFTDFINFITFEVHPGTRTVEQLDIKDGSNSYKVKLENGEYITSFAGCFKNVEDKVTLINSLTFVTNKRTLGPIGREEGVYFYVPLPSNAGKVIEFFASFSIRDNFLTSIGARVELLRHKFCPVGLFGSRKGFKWDSGNRYTTVRGIRLGWDSSGILCIQLIPFQNDRVDGQPSRSEFEIDGPDFEIDGPDEYLSSISGYCTYDGITSLTFLTNKKRSKTFGDVKGKGTHFSSPTTGCKIVGFYGWSDEHHFYGIGAYFKPISDLHPIKSIGPFGGGNAWDDGKFKGVKKIDLFVDGYIHYIMFVYDDGSEYGCTVMHGDYTEGVFHEKYVVDLDYPREYLTSISGYTRKDGCIQSLTFYSNRKRHGFFGKEEGEYFCSPLTGSKIIGFYGTWGRTLNSIGVYVEPIPHLDPFYFMPFRGSGGNDWDDEVHSNVIGYRVTVSKSKRGSDIIESITFMYENNGSLVEGSRHGGGDGGKWKMLDYPKERLTWITGYWCKGECGQTIIHDLKIETAGADKTAPLYAKRGELKGNYFSIPGQSDTDRKIIGFCGTAGTYLNSIGAYLEPYYD